MEMHQVRYFLAVSRALNFTRAAEECHVAQPSLTRAIKQLEGELGSELFRRERNFTHMTEFGQRMLPHLQQCYDCAATAKELATSLKTGAVAPVSIALSTAIELTVLVPHLTELVRAFEGLELRLLRGSPPDVFDVLKKGDADIAVAGPMRDAWDRLDSWPLFTEHFCLALNKAHPLAKRSAIEPEDLSNEHLLWRTYCEHAAELEEFLKKRKLHTAITHKVASEHDLLALVEANLGVGVLPSSAPRSKDTKFIPINGLDLGRTVYLYSVAGRQRSPAAAALIKLMRAADWSDFST